VWDLYKAWFRRQRGGRDDLLHGRRSRWYLVGGEGYALSGSWQLKSELLGGYWRVGNLPRYTF
jgi:hypothetical protein